MFIQVCGVYGNIGHIICEVTNGVSGEQLLEPAHNTVPSDTAHRVSVRTDLSGKGGHEIHEVRHIHRESRENPVHSGQCRSEIKGQFVCHADKACGKGHECRRQLYQNGSTKTNGHREKTRTGNRSRTQSRSHYTNANQKPGANTDTGSNRFSVVDDGLPCLTDLVKTLSNGPDLNDEQTGCDT